ncbi:FprA family A-type flavoprotein [Candidatus Beckwithbacteria bacterium]|nr:FprA family A-type flavoprotein [Candidatus Beckwithbacteria bacterium]
MEVIEIKNNIFWVGAVDNNLRHFHGYTFATPNGSTYNSYLILDEHPTLIDGVWENFTDEWLVKIKSKIDVGKIENLIINHTEPDHSRSLPKFIELNSKIKIYGTRNCQQSLEKQYALKSLNFNVVKTGDELQLGTKKLKFLEAPMIHWPDSMFTYCPEEKLLLSNDAFGQHFASQQRFDTEVDLDKLKHEAMQYYANILWPFSNLISSKLKEVENLAWQIDMIAPSHGLIWKNPQTIIDLYGQWTKGATKARAVIIFETMWGVTEIMANTFAQGLKEADIKVKVMDLNKFTKTEIITAMFEANGFMFGSSTHDNGVLPNMAGFLHFLKGLKPTKRIGMAFSSFGWGAVATGEIEKYMAETGINKAMEAINIQFHPNEEELKKCFETGKMFGEKIKTNLNSLA